MRRLGISVSIIALVVLNSCTDYREEDPSVTFGVNTTELSFLTGGDSRSVTVSSGRKWDVPTMPQWISLQSITRSGISPYEWTASFSAASNEEYNREGRIVIKAGAETAEISVFQDGKKGRYVAVESVSVSPSELTLTEGDNSSLSLVFTPSNASVQTVSWKSSSPTVATVSQSGRIDALAEGTTLITVTTEDGGKTASCAVTVKAKVIPVSGITLDKTSLSMTEGDEQTLSASVTPSNATDKSVTWSSSNTSVATVSSSGVVTAKAAGSATITVTTNDGGKTTKCSVTVSEAVIEAIDLGLSVKWGSFNLGAKKPEEAGAYFSWGEISPKNEYTWQNYKFRVTGDRYDNVTFSKYVLNPSFGTVDNKSVLDPEDDAAHVHLGGSWRMPTVDEVRELIDNCTAEWTTLNGVNGRKLTSKKTGYTDKWIFLPAAGFWYETSFYSSEGAYWTSSLYNDYAHYLRVSSQYFYLDSYARLFGYSIRPVYGDPAKVSVTGVSLNKTSLSMTVGDTQTLTATVTPSNATDKSVTWSSSNTSVATVSSSGVVTAKAAGSATITVTTNDGGKKATCSVTVNAKTVSVTGVSLNKTSLSMTVGDTQTLTATITPSNATDKSVTWSSSNTSVATVSSSGVVTAKAAGSATITVTTNDGGKKATCSVTVSAATVAVTGVSLNKTSLSMTVGDAQTLTATVTPSNATDKSVTWSSNNTSVATVSSSGVVTAKAAGSATITVTTTDGGKKATCSVTVQTQTVSVTGVSLNKTSLLMTEGDTQTLTATITPSNATDKSVTWSSSNTSVATVSSVGVVTAKVVGSATITVRTNDGGKTATCTVTVEAPALTNNVIFYTSTNGSTVTPYAMTAFGANLVSNEYKNGRGILTFDGDVTCVGYTAFMNCSTLASIQLPNTVTSIDGWAFFGCSGLYSIDIPDFVTSIGESAFASCSSLTSVGISNSVKSIGETAFSTCSALNSILIPSSVTSIADDAFRFCSGIESISVATNNTTYDSRNGCNAIIETKTNTLIRGCQNTIIPNTVKALGKGALNLCPGLTSIRIPSSVTSIESDSFFYCYNLATIIVDSGNSVYDSRNSCNAIIETKSNKLVIGCQKSVIPNTVTTIGNSAFSDCTNLSSIQIPNSVTTIEAYAFYGCRGLKTLEIPSSVKTIGYLAFHICESLTSITCYPTTPPTLGERAFDATNDSPIYVPSQSLNAYITATNWSAYANRIKAIQ